MFNIDLGSWNTSSITNMISMFQDCPVFNQQWQAWDVSSVINMSNGCTAFNQPLENWNVSSVMNMDSMFYETPLAGTENIVSNGTPNISQYFNQ